MVSVVITTYNGAAYIKKQLESIRLQTRQPDEVIIKEDCSSDNTASVISGYINMHELKHWKFSINEKNLGYKDNFYRGISETKGDYIFLCDQDDEWRQDKIERMMDVFERHPEIWALNCGLSMIDSESRHLHVTCEKNWTNCNFLYSKRVIDNLTFFSPDYILRHNIGPGCAMAIDKRTKEGFLKSYNSRLPHDWHMNMIAAINGGCAFLNEQLLFYRCHFQNVIGANTKTIIGIKEKTNDVRIDDYESRINSYINICNEYGHKPRDNEKEALSLVRAMADFYKAPSLSKLKTAKGIAGYRELAKRKVRFWEILVALHVDRIIREL